MHRISSVHKMYRYCNTRNITIYRVLSLKTLTKQSGIWQATIQSMPSIIQPVQVSVQPQHKTSLGNYSVHVDLQAMFNGDGIGRLQLDWHSARLHTGSKQQVSNKQETVTWKLWQWNQIMEHDSEQQTTLREVSQPANLNLTTWMETINAIASPTTTRYR